LHVLPLVALSATQVLVNGKPVAVQVKTSVEKTFEKPKVVVHAGCVLDASTSMTWAADPKTDHSKTKMVSCNFKCTYKIG